MAWLAVEFQIAAKRLAVICEPAQPGGFLELELPPPCRLN